MSVEKVPTSVEIPDTESIDLSANKSKDSISEYPSAQFKLV